MACKLFGSPPNGGFLEPPKRRVFFVVFLLKISGFASKYLLKILCKAGPSFSWPSTDIRPARGRD